jgi:alkanesulfonate monooxygenase SsuD/methylene tetrahydromethanopterin reductase-like flavin-dependent oxidoreductase (luciferase family)
MRFSIWPTPTNRWEDILATVRHADPGGWHGVWFADHYMPNTDSEEIVDGPMLEAWSVLGALAGATTRVRLGPLVSPTTVHHPALLANRAAAIDRISGGRFVLGLGAGWQINEHHAYGIDLLEPGRRVDRFEEAIQIVRSLLDSSDRTSFEGEHFQIHDAPCEPAPIQSPLPLLVGTGSRRMMRITARHADEWNTWGEPDLAGERARAFDAACQSVERDPASVHRSVQALVYFTDDADTAARRRAGFEGRVIAGSTAEVLDSISRYADLGFAEFILQDSTLGRELQQRLDTLDRFWTEVASPLIS